MEQAQTLSNTQLVKNAFAYFGQGNIPALLNELTDDVKWHTPGPKSILPWAGTYNGKQGVAEFFKAVSETTDFLVFEPREFIAENDKVVALGYLEGKSKKTGRISKNSWVMVFTLRNGRLCNFEEYSDTYTAVETYK